MVTADSLFFPGADGFPSPWEERRSGPFGVTLCADVVRSGAPIVVESFARDRAAESLDALLGASLGASLFDTSEAEQQTSLGAYLGVPLSADEGHVLGAMFVGTRSPRSWRASELEQLGQLASLVEDLVRLRRNQRRLRAVDMSCRQIERELRDRVGRVGHWIDDLQQRCVSARARLDVTLRELDSLEPPELAERGPQLLATVQVQREALCEFERELGEIRRRGHPRKPEALDLRGVLATAVAEAGVFADARGLELAHLRNPGPVIVELDASDAWLMLTVPLRWALSRARRRVSITVLRDDALELIIDHDGPQPELLGTMHPSALLRDSEYAELVPMLRVLEEHRGWVGVSVASKGMLRMTFNVDV